MLCGVWGGGADRSLGAVAAPVWGLARAPASLKLFGRPSSLDSRRFDVSSTHIESTLNSTRARPRARSFIFETSLVRATRHGRSPPTCLHTREKERKASKAASAGQCSAAQRGAAEGRFEHRLLPAIIPPSLGAALGHARSWPALGLQARAPDTTLTLPFEQLRHQPGPLSLHG